MDIEERAHTDQVLSTFISQLLTGVVESVCQQGYQVAFLASKGGEGSNDILSLHGGLSLNIQKQLEVNFRNLIKEAAQQSECSISQSEEETMKSTRTVSIPLRDVLADTIKVECTSEFDASLTGDAVYSISDNDADIPIEYNDGQRLDEEQEVQIKTELPNDLQIEHDDTLTESFPEPESTNTAAATELSANSSCGRLRGKKKCKYCEYTTDYKSKLMSHMRTHTGEKPFACTKCPYRSTQRSQVTSHMMTHTGEKPFACPECPFRSSLPSNLRSHILTHTGEKPFACKYCPFRSAKQQNVKRHAAKSHQEVENNPLKK